MRVGRTLHNLRSALEMYGLLASMHMHKCEG
jgi:hypothetical protein